MRKTNRLKTALTLLTLVLLGVAAHTAEAQESTFIAKDSVLVNVSTYDAYRKNEDVWSWAPDLRFRIRGPVGSDDLVYVEYNIPGSAVLRFDCPVRLNPRDDSRLEVNCSSYGINEKGPTFTGLVPFRIKMRNELKGTNEVTLFAGTMKVMKLPPPPNEPRGHFVYYVDYDWTLPIAYLFYLRDSDGEWELPKLHVVFWVRGNVGSFIPYIFNKGEQVNVPSGQCSHDFRTGTDTINWTRMDCTFNSVAGWDPRKSQRNPDILLLDSHPGEYEVKVLQDKRLSRVLKFTVGADGDISNGIAEASRINTNRVIVPIQILGNTDGQWNREAWRTDAFYGNPLKGFTAAP